MKLNGGKIESGAASLSESMPKYVFRHQNALSGQSDTFWDFQNFLAEVRILSVSADETYSRWHDSSRSL
jgi:hypothetical protein